MKNSIIVIIALFFSIGLYGQQTSALTDSRDGKTYKTVQIGTQTWMAENLAYITETDSWAFANEESNVPIFGRLYNWEVAKNACPDGWILPSKNDWDELFTYLGGTEIAGDKLKDANSKIWITANVNTSTISGFSALPGHYYGNSWQTLGKYAYFWSSTNISRTYSNYIEIAHDASNVNILGGDKQKIALSVRCLKKQ